MKKVINKYYCDRCGKKLDHKPDWGILVDIRGSKDFASLNAELCDECTESFKKWWEDVSKEIKEINN